MSFERATTMRPIFASKLLTGMDRNPFDNCQNVRCSNHLLNVVENMHVRSGSEILDDLAIPPNDPHEGPLSNRSGTRLSGRSGVRRLCAILGWQNVFDFPRKAAYHDPEARVDYLAQNPGHTYGLEDFAGMIRERQVDLAILSSPRRGVVDACRALAARVELTPVVLLDGEDDSRIREDLFRSVGAALYFKREFPIGVGRWGGPWFDPVGDPPRPNLSAGRIRYRFQSQALRWRPRRMFPEISIFHSSAEPRIKNV